MKYLFLIPFILSCATKEVKSPYPERTLSACLVNVHNRGKPTEDMVMEIIDLVGLMDYSDFEVNDNYDIYSHMQPKFAEFTKDIDSRRALMAGVLVNLAGWESSWDWTEGVDTTNPASMANKCGEEAGLLQTSADSMANFNASSGGSLKAFFDESCKEYTGGTDCERFIKCSKDPGGLHYFTIQYTAKLLRHTTNHHGPIKRKSDVYSSLSTECVRQIRSFL